ncbi:hypothetical protein AB6N24_14970 [Cellulomonas sp. 179-A 4D5 NHS]|uniref:hypothetical protein n=1 Tax=Cellulomonas sp. 179-A 4D5 NHS TaxID=3142378 RepID=UPI0039A3395F
MVTLKNKLAALATFDSQQAVSLVVGWRTSSGRYNIRRLRLSQEVANDLRELTSDAAAQIIDREPESWAPDADLVRETVLGMPLTDIDPTPDLTAEHNGRTFFEELRGGADVPKLEADKIPAATLSFYSIAVGDTVGNRTVFLRRSNPQRSLKGGRRLTVYREQLVRVEEPLFGFDSIVDLVIHDDHMWVLSQTAFANLFREDKALTGQVPIWVGDVSASVPMTAGGAARLQAKALRDSRASRRLEAIARRGHLTSVTSQQLRDAMIEHDLDPDTLLDANGDLILDEADIPTILQFLNEDLFVGTLSSTAFRADKKHSI